MTTRTKPLDHSLPAFKGLTWCSGFTASGRPCLRRLFTGSELDALWYCSSHKDQAL